MRKVKYYKNQRGLDLSVEKDFLNNKKAYRVLVSLAQEPKDLSDKNMAIVSKMSFNTYQKWKSHLVMIGLLQVRQLNAITYFISLGADAIEMDDKIHSGKDDERIIELVIESLGYDTKIVNISSGNLFIDDPKKKKYIPYLSPSEAARYNKILKSNPMPDTDVIL